MITATELNDIRLKETKAGRRSRVLRMLPFFAAALALAAVASPARTGVAAGAVQVEAPDYANSRLVGTLNGGGFSGAVFEDSSGKQQFYRAGETFADGSSIAEVKRKSILIRTADGNLVEYRVVGGKPGRAPAVRPGWRRKPPVRRSPYGVRRR